MAGTLGVYRWELRKLVSQKRTYLGLIAATLVPLLFTIALTLQKGQPNDVAFGRYVRESGLAIPLVLLLFGPTRPALWGPPPGGLHAVLWKGRRSDPLADRPAPGLLTIRPREVTAALAAL